MDCPSCHATVPEEARFCSRCGVPVRREVEGDVPDELREALKVALGRQYEVVRLLGKGGMGAVYLARETFLERYVAIKVLPPDRGATEESRERFRREARTAARLSHPNIVPLHTFGEVDGLLYFVMGFVKGESLGARLRREGRLDAEEARRLLLEVASALEHAHGFGIVHRDVKPDNVLIEEGTGRALLTDFGVAKSPGTGPTMTVVGAVLGTPHFMSPEQAQGRSDIGPPSDLYSLGVMGYAMLAGRLPFDGGTPGDVLLQHITAEVPPLSARAPGVPITLASVITRCLAKDPAARWPDAGSLRSALVPPDEAELPQPLEELRESASLGLVFCAVVLYLAAWRAGGGPGALPAVLLPTAVLAGIAIPALLWVLRLRVARRAGFDLSRALFETFRKPARWIGDYPPRFREERDVWARLPPALRRSRSWWGRMMLAFVLVLGPLVTANIAYDANVRSSGRAPFPASVRDTLTYGLAAVGLFPALLAFVAMARWRREARDLGLDSETALSVVLSPTTRRSFWGQPRIGALLQPPSKGGGRAQGSGAGAKPGGTGETFSLGERPGSPGR